MKRTIIFWFFITVTFSASSLSGVTRDSVAITYQFDEAQVILEDDSLYFQFQVMAAALEEGTRLGTGILLINYNSTAFGVQLFTNGRVEMERGPLLITEGPPLYNVIVQDNNAQRLGITFEYNSAPGYGNYLEMTDLLLVTVRFSVQTSGETAGLSFQEDLMLSQQYHDDNATLYHPVIAEDTDDTLLLATDIEPDIINIKQRLDVTSYPNPANPVIHFDIRNEIDGIVTIDIFNVKGQLVRKLQVEGDTEQNNFFWDGRDQQSKTVGNGIYYYYIKSRDSACKGKFTILK